MTRAEYRDRRERLLAKLDQQDNKVDAFLVTHLANVRYLTGFTGSNAALLIRSRGPVLFTDPRYGVQAVRETGIEVKVIKGPTWKGIAKALKRIPKTGFEPSHLTCDLHEHYKAVTWLEPVKPLVEGLREVKSAAEIVAIRNSVDLNSAAFNQALRKLRACDTELDLAAEIDYQQKRLGAQSSAFETIVASGKHGALPHARPRRERIEAGELLLIDMGALREGYASDMTRMVFLGRPSGQIRRYYQAVLSAQLAAIDAVKPGVRTAHLDRIARETLRSYRLDKLFTHSLGHGLGLEIHESPGLRKQDKTVLSPGMTITIEPGIYRKDFGGIRIEDTVLVTETGCEVLTKTPKDLQTF